MSVKIREADESLFDDEIHLCLPPKDSEKYVAFEGGVKEKRIWLRQRFAELGSVAQIAYHDHEPVAFIEYVSAKNAPVPFVEDKTALITCINKPKFEGKGVGSALVKAALGRLRELGVEDVKVLVSSGKEWINGGVFFKNGFQIERSFYKPSAVEPLDLLTHSFEGRQKLIGGKTTVKFVLTANDSLPVHVACFGSGQCPFSALVRARLREAVGSFDSRFVVLEVLDTWENCRLARECGAMYGNIFINGKAPFWGPASQEKIEEEIRKEIERIKTLG